MPAPNIVDRMKDIAKIRDKEKIERLRRSLNDCSAIETGRLE